MDRTSIFGWMAMTITFVYKLPQIYKFYRSKTALGVSVLSYIIQAIGYILYAVHGYFINDYPVTIMGITSYFMNMILCFQYLYYKNRYDKEKKITDNI